MRIDIVGKHLAITDAIRTYAEQKAEKLTKVFDGTQQIRVYLEKSHHANGEYEIEVVADVVKHDDFVAKVKHADLYAGIDVACDKCLRQLRDFKDKLRS